ncbi:MAG: hypothetical protein DRI81_07180 [Chloroflexi bacterium]|nr:MAG: hypothetical protein DRI81_07180 [Chloroflexota bacterium]
MSLDVKFRHQIGKMLHGAALATQAQEPAGEFMRGRMAAFEAAACALDCTGNGGGLDIIFRSESLNILSGLVFLCMSGSVSNFEHRRGMLSGYYCTCLMLGGDLGVLASQARQNVGAVGLLVDAGQPVIESKKRNEK